MEKHIFWLQIITILMQVVLLFLTYFLNIIKENKDYIKSINKERYTKFHSVFIQLLFTDYVLDVRPSEQKFAVLREYFLCIRENLMYVGEITLQLHENFIKSLFEILPKPT